MFVDALKGIPQMFQTFLFSGKCWKWVSKNISYFHKKAEIDLTGVRTQVVGFKVPSDYHYTIRSSAMPP
jgi:hypothetical protein